MLTNTNNGNKISLKTHLKTSSSSSENSNERENLVMQVGDVKLLISELKKVKVLGHGSSGLVEKAVHESTGIVLSIKVILSKKKRESNRFTDCPL